MRCATLAASSHNAQCWKFRLDGRGVAILPDLSRRCPAVDPDDHHLFASLGCAAENLAQAARAYGLEPALRFDPDAGNAIRVDLGPSRPAGSALFDAIPHRRSTRAEYDGKPLSADAQRLLERAGRGEGVEAMLLTARPRVEEVLDFVIRGNSAQMADPAFVEELKAWIRFSEADAVATRDGLFAGASGNPAVPRWLGSLLLGLFFTAGSENDRYARQIRSSAGVAVFFSETDDPAHWVEAGRCCQRFALQATALGVRTAFVNQPVEVAELRPRFAAMLGMGGRRPDLVMRFGYGPEMPRSLRRPVEAVIV